MRGIRSVALALLLIPLVAAPVFAGGIAVGAYGGYNFTVLQDDQGHGGLFGLKAKIAIPAVELEPSITFVNVKETTNNDEEIGDFKQPGGSIDSYGLNVNYGSMKPEPGFGFYGTGGIGAYKLKPDVQYKDSETRFGWNVGLGMVFGVAPKVDIDVSGRFHVITLDGGGSRKNVGINAGVGYYFGI